MANIYTGNGLKIFYNEDTANRLPQNAGNEQISEIAAMPTLHIAAAMAQVETYNSEYVEQLAGEQNVDPVEITVNYIPGDYTHTFLDEATETQKEFQLILIRRHSEGTLDYSLMNGRISAAALSGDKDSVVQKTYTFTPTEMIVRDATALASVELYEGSYGVGSNGVDVPQYEPLTPTGNSFIKVPADQIGNPVSVDMMGVGLVDGNTFSSIAMTKSGSLAIYAKNQTTAWTRILTSNLGDSKYVALTGDQSIDGTKTFIKGIYVDSLTASNGISGKSLIVTESIKGESITVDNSTLGTAQADNLTLGQPLSVGNGGTGSKNATDARSALGVKAAGTFDIVPIANGGTNASTALQARINLDLISKTESDTRYLKTASNLSDLTDVGAARTNLELYSKSESDVRYMMGNRNLSELTDKATALINLGIFSTTQNDARYLMTSRNLSDLTDKVSARGNLQVDSVRQSTGTTSGDYNAFTNPSGTYELRIANSGDWRVAKNSDNSTALLAIAAGGTGAWNAAGARQNFEIERYNQSPSETYIQSPDRKKYLTISNTAFGLWDTSANAFIPLGMAQGGTGSITINGARTNLQVDRLKQQDNGTLLQSPSGLNSLFVYNGNDWGCIDSSTAAVKPLKIEYGGTSATTLDGARNNLNLGTQQAVDFASLTLNIKSDIANTNGGILTSRLLNTSNGIRSVGRLYTEILDDGIPRFTLHAGDGASRNSYMLYTCTGNLSGINNVNINLQSNTDTQVVRTNMTIGQTTNTNALGPRSIAIGDSDTGIAQREDGILDIYANSQRITTITPNLITNNKQMNFNVAEINTHSIQSTTRNGGAGTFITGIISGDGGWATWRDRAAGMIVQPSGENQVTSIWKCTRWGDRHIAAMGVYNPNAASDPVGDMVNLTCGSNGWYFYGSNGSATGVNWVSSSDKRLKTNLEPITGALDKILQLTGYTYDKRSSYVPDEYTTTTHEAGLIAQDVQKVLPEAVTVADPDGMLGVSSYGVQALVINSIKELNDKVDSITVPNNELDEMRNTIKVQQSQIDELKALVQSLLNK